MGRGIVKEACCRIAWKIRKIRDSYQFNAPTSATGWNYDSLARLASLSVRYNAARQVVGTVSPDPDGSGPLKHRAVRNTYDSSTGLPTKVEQGNVDSQSDGDWAAFSAAQAAETAYDSNARPVTSKLVSGSTIYALTQTSYDGLGRPECTAQRMDSADFASTLPGACALTSPTGGEGPDRIVKAFYDAAGRVTEVKTALGTADEASEVRTTYTDNGLVQTVKDGENNLTTYEYDGYDRLAKIRYPDSTKGAGTSSTGDYEQTTYESLAGATRTSGLVTAFRNRGGDTIGFGYDSLGRLTSKDRPGAEPDVTYGYDLLGRMTSASQTGNALSFTYDALGRLRTETGPLGTMTSDYDLGGRRTRLTWPDTFYVTYDHLVTGETTKIRENGAASGIGVLATFDYDQLGRRTSLTRGTGVVTTYQPDPVSRLQQLKLDFAGTANDLTLDFAYNPASQITSTTRSNDLYAWTGHGSGTISTTSNGRNQIAGWITTLAYDAKGNVTSDGTYGYTYSSENLLTSLTNPTPGAVQSASTFAYDPLMRLAKIDSSKSALDADLGYDGQEIILEGLSSNRTRRYVFGPGIDEPLVAYLVTSTGTSRTWLQADERGSIVRLTDDTGTPNAAFGKYDEYGVGTGLSRFHYTGQYWLGDGNLHYYRARVYDPRLGRFLQPDPIGYEGGMNLYAYVGGDPVNFTDPLGLAEEPGIPVDCDAACRARYQLPGPGSGAAALFGSGHSGGNSASASSGAPDGSPAELIDGGRRDPDVTCLSGGCWEIEIARPPGKTAFYFNGRRYVPDSRYVQPWYGKYMEYAFVLGPPVIALGVAVAPEVIAVEGPRRALFQYGRGRLMQVRFGKDWLKLRVDVRKPNTHVNIETRTRNIHWPK
jgi:RHS repeat-associated protein